MRVYTVGFLKLRDGQFEHLPLCLKFQHCKLFLCDKALPSIREKFLWSTNTVNQHVSFTLEFPKSH